MLSADKMMLIYSDWVTPLKGPTYLTLLDLKELMKDHLQEKIIFNTSMFANISSDLIISPDDVIWAKQNIFVICKKMPGLAEHYVFKYDLEKNVSSLVEKLDKHKTGLLLKSFYWNEQKNRLEINYEGRNESGKYKYDIPVMKGDN